MKDWRRLETCSRMYICSQDSDRLVLHALTHENEKDKDAARRKRLAILTRMQLLLLQHQPVRLISSPRLKRTRKKVSSPSQSLDWSYYMYAYIQATAVVHVYTRLLTHSLTVLYSLGKRQSFLITMRSFVRCRQKGDREREGERENPEPNWKERV